MVAARLAARFSGASARALRGRGLAARSRFLPRLALALRGSRCGFQPYRCAAPPSSLAFA
jgi:hypothetical protein